jgi:hypothetical protein
LAQDALDLMDALGIKTFSVIGHDRAHGVCACGDRSGAD